MFMADGEKRSTKLKYLGQSSFQILHPIIRTNLLILSQKISFLLLWSQNEEQQTLKKHISYFLQNANIVHSECPPISPKDFDLKLVNATDIFLGCYFLEPIGIFSSSFSAKKSTCGVFFHRPFSFFKNWAILSLLEDSALGPGSGKTLLPFLVPTVGAGLFLDPASGSALLAHSFPGQKWLILLVLVWPPLSHFTDVQGHRSTQPLSSASSPPVISPKAQDQCDTVKHRVGLCPRFWHRASEILGISWVMKVRKAYFGMLMRWLLDPT